jgi:hypothetical protein
MRQPDTWVIIGLAQGELVNLVIWDGDQLAWVAPPGTYAVRLSDIPPGDLPSSPDTVI